MGGRLHFLLGRRPLSTAAPGVVSGGGALPRRNTVVSGWSIACGAATLSSNTSNEGGSEQMAGTIACGVDGSPGAAEAARVATDLSAQLDLRVVLVHVAHGFTSEIGDESLTTLQARLGGERLVRRIAAELGLDESRVEVGDPAEQLAQVAAEERAALILVGARARRRWRPLLRSDVARDLAGVTQCPVLVVPPRGAGTRRAEPFRLAAA
jgi:nucleotide-binding universal stress UspA family protein